MALDFQQVRKQIKELGEQAPSRAVHLNMLRTQASHLLVQHAHNLEALREKVDLIVRNYDPNLRCAAPTLNLGRKPEPLDSCFTLPTPPKRATLLAADGSQITPDRHAAAYFGLINVGVIRMQVDSPAAPQTTTDSYLFYDEEVFNLTEASLNLKRDLRERTLLAELSEGAPKPVIAFTDGPLELWGAKADGSEEFQESLEAYLKTLRRLKDLGVSSAGYVDKPAANLVVRLLELAEYPEGQLSELKNDYPLRGVTDDWLYRRLLGPGERSSVFAIQSRSARHYRNGLALHFFYLNVGRLGNPWLARVEIPAWVAEDRQTLDHLHALLVGQCRILGNRSYPYLLHRAHEAALVTLEERAQVAQMIVLELRGRGLEVGEISHKQAVKDLPRRRKQ